MHATLHPVTLTERLRLSPRMDLVSAYHLLGDLVIVLSSLSPACARVDALADVGACFAEERESIDLLRAELADAMYEPGKADGEAPF